ncbi:MAG TPA: hypothetical protein VGC78_08625 [Gaiellaceae bacterium]
MRARLVTAVVAAAILAGAAAWSSTAAPEPRVLVVGDSVATGMSWHDDAIAAMQRNLAVQWQVAVCRTVGGVSCPFDGERPPTLLQLVPALGRVPPIVVVVMGYNDPPDEFPGSLDDALGDLVGAGAQHVLWLTLHAVRAPYPELNDDLRQAARRWPQLELVDWDRAAAAHPEWFQSDAVHLLDAGGVAMAHIAHAAVVRLVSPLRITSTLRFGDGQRTVTRLHAAGGTPPYVWRVARGRPPRGFHLGASGAVVARARPGSRSTFSVSVTDADGASAVAPASFRPTAAHVR